MNCSLVTLSDKHLAQMMEGIGQQATLTQEDVADWSQIEHELTRRLRDTILALESATTAEAAEVQQWVPLAGNA